jgi:hypothetical protein
MVIFIVVQLRRPIKDILTALEVGFIVYTNLKMIRSDSFGKIKSKKNA